MAKVKCITMQRDERTLLEPWLRYYGHLFGFENLFVFDNGSVQPDVIETLRFYEKLGVEIRWEQASREDYFNKGFHFRNIILHWDNVGDYDYALPVDCDEFLALFTDGAVSCRRSLIHAALDRLTETARPLGLDLSLNNVPQRPGWFWAEPRPKSFLPARSVGHVDFHNREIETEAGGAAVDTNFTFLHHRYRPIEEHTLHACHKLGIDGLPTPLEALQSHADPEVMALARTLVSEKSYLAGFDARLLVQVPEFSLLLEALGTTDVTLVDNSLEPNARASLLRLPKRKPRGTEQTVTFEAASYNDLHSDIAAGDALALKHYLVYGSAEGREI